MDTTDQTATTPPRFWIRVLPLLSLAGVVGFGIWRALRWIDAFNAVPRAPGLYATHYAVPAWPILMVAVAFGLIGIQLLSRSYWYGESDRDLAHLHSAVEWAQSKPEGARGTLLAPLEWLLDRRTRRRNSRTAQLSAATTLLATSLTMFLYAALR